MFVTNEFIHVHIPKTGGQFIDRCLGEVFNFERLTGNGYHCSTNEIPSEFITIPKFAFIRNPWDWYVSWYHFHKQLNHIGKGVAVYQVCSRNSKLSFIDTITNCVTLHSNPYMVRQIKKRIIQDINHHTMLGYKINYIDMILNTYEGLYTHMFNYVTGDHVNSITFGRTENLVEDLISILSQYINITDNQLDFLRTIDNVNVSERKKYQYYYDEDLIELIRLTDNKIITNFDYKY